MRTAPHAVPMFVPNEFGGVLKYFGDENTEEYWDAMWDRLEGRIDYSRAETGHLPRQLKATFLRWVKPGARVMEAGCGLAEFTVATRALGFLTDGVDFAPNVIARNRARHPDIPFIVADLRNLDGIADATYDAMYSPGVVEHFEEGPEPLLREANRVLKPGGVIVVSTPSFNVFLRAMHRLGRFRRRPPGPFAWYAFSVENMTSILEREGFDVVQVHHYGVLLTLRNHVPLVGRLGNGLVAKVLSVGLDTIPLVRRCGHSCLWVGVKRPS